MNRHLRVAVDIGGTFTDLVAYDPSSGQILEAKVATTPGDFSLGVLNAIHASQCSPPEIGELIHGTTVVINAITQRAGVRTALITTAGFRDALAIGRGNRPDMYNLKFHKPTPFVPRRLRFEMHERVSARGEVLVPLDLVQLQEIIAACRQERVEAVAVCFLHSYLVPDHERAVAASLAQHMPEVAVTVSSDIVKEWREYERSNTAVLNAYVQPIFDRYLGNLERHLAASDVAGQCFTMLSNGGTATFASARRRPIELVESGPAGGIIGAALVGAQIGESNLISLDIGGTTAKCSLIENGEIKISSDYRLEWTPLSPGYPIRVPVVDIVEIGAGGGSIAWFDEGGALRVGPRSAGAEPGPACYGQGGTEPTVTDAMLIAGVIDPASFLGGRLVLDIDRARRAYAPIAERLSISVEAAATGVIRLVNEATIDALKLISVRRGYDPRDFTLVAFGGGGPMHAAALALELGVKRVIIPPLPGTFSAWGMLMTNPRIDLVQTRVTDPANTTPEELDLTFRVLEDDAALRFIAQGFDAGQKSKHQRSAEMRYQGQEHTVRVPVPDGSVSVPTLMQRFHDIHKQNYTFALVGTPVEIVHFRTISTIEMPRPMVGQAEIGGNGAAAVTRIDRRAVDFGDGIAQETAIFVRSALTTGFVATGPAIIEEASATTVVPPGQQVEVDRFGNLVVSVVVSAGATN